MVTIRSTTLPRGHYHQMDEETSARPSGRRDLGRLEAFSDGVMAVIITIMAFELKAPMKPTAAALRHELPSLLVYALSFTFVGLYWNNHHHLLRSATRFNGTVMWANHFLLFWLSLIPVLTEWVQVQYRHALPAAAYGVAAVGAALAYTALVRALIRVNGRDSALARAIGSDAKGRASLLLYVGGVGLAWVSVWLSYALYVAVAVMWFVPDRRFDSV